MSAKNVLSQEEIDTLLTGVESGEVEAGTGLPVADDELYPFDFSDQEHLARNHLPRLETVNQRFVRHFGVSLYRMLKRTAQVTLGELRVVKYGEYVDSLETPSSINLIRIHPLTGLALIVMDPMLVFLTVDNYFGGDGRFQSRRSGVEFSPTERRIIQLLINLSFEDLKKAWQPVVSVDFEYTKSEINPRFANIVTPTELVAVTPVDIELDGGGGEFHLVYPLSMLEPIREQLESGLPKADGKADAGWLQALRADLLKVKVELDSTLIEVPRTLGEVLRLEPGDVIPVDIPKQVTVRAAGVPVLEGSFGVAQGKNAIRIQEQLTQSPSNSTQEHRSRT